MKTELTKEFEGLTPKEIKDVLEGMCSSAQEMQIRRELKPNERTQLEQEFVNLSVNGAIYKDNFEKIKQKFKTDMAPIDARNSEIIQSFRSNAVEIEGMVYYVANQESGQMESYDEVGTFLQSRPLLPEERQRSVMVDSVMELVNDGGKE